MPSPRFESDYFIRIAVIALLGLSIFAVLKQRRGLREHHQASDFEGGLKIATWNLQWFPGRKQKPDADEAEAHFDAVVETIIELDADILCLQEVRELPGNIELMKLAEATGYTIQTVSNFNYRQEVAILSRQPAVASFFENFEDRAREKNPPRGFAYAHFRIDGYPEIHLYSVHLKSNAGGGIEKNTPKREEAARQLLTHIEHVAGNGAVVITGDFACRFPYFEALRCSNPTAGAIFSFRPPGSSRAPSPEPLAIRLAAQSRCRA